MPILFIFNGDNMVFENNVYTVWSNSNIAVGDVVELTTSKFDYDVVTGRFESVSRCFEIEVKIIEEDLSNYQWETSRYGGNYGYAIAEVTKVKEVI